jgi:hypothetical protein
LGENASKAASEGFLKDSKKKYPAIPAIEVSIPHVSCLLKVL